MAPTPNGEGTPLTEADEGTARIRRQARRLLDAKDDLHSTAVYQALSRLHDQVMDPGARKRRTPFLLLLQHAAVHLLPMACAIASHPDELAALGVPAHGLSGLSGDSQQQLVDQMPNPESDQSADRVILWAVSEPPNNASTLIDVFVLPMRTAGSTPPDRTANTEPRILEAVRHSGLQARRDPLRIVALASSLLRDRSAFHELAKRCDELAVPPIFAVFPSSVPVDPSIVDEIAQLRPTWALLQPVALALSACSTITHLVAGYVDTSTAGRPPAERGTATRRRIYTALMHDLHRLTVLLQSEAPPLDTHFLAGVRADSCGAERVVVVADSSAERALLEASAAYSDWRAMPEGTPPPHQGVCWQAPASLREAAPLFPSEICVIAGPDPEAIQRTLLQHYVTDRRDVAIFALSEEDRVAWGADQPATAGDTTGITDSPDTQAGSYIQAIVDFIIGNNPEQWAALQEPPPAKQHRGWLHRFSGLPSQLRRALASGRGALGNRRSPLAYTTMEISTAVLNRQNPRFFLCLGEDTLGSIAEVWVSKLFPALLSSAGNHTQRSSESGEALRRSMFRDRVVQQVLCAMDRSTALADAMAKERDTEGPKPSPEQQHNPIL